MGEGIHEYSMPAAMETWSALHHAVMIRVGEGWVGVGIMGTTC